MAQRTVVTLTTRREQAVAAAASDAATAFGEKKDTVAEAAAEATVSVHTIRRAYEHGHLRVLRFGIGGRGIRIRRADLAAWLEAGGRTDRVER
jgi:excisionase family DNA binding protein